MSFAFFDARCTRCSRKIGWRGRYVDMPMCRCGYRPPQSELERADSNFAAIKDRIRAETKARRDAEWAADQPVAAACYAEGQDAATTHGARGPDGRRPLPSDMPNPYVATRTPDGKFWELHSRWWFRGWRDAELGVDRRTDHSRSQGAADASTAAPLA